MLACTRSTRCLAGSDRAPRRARADVTVHADCDRGNWLVENGRVTALLDFERTRLGDPVDDRALLAVTGGAHLPAVLDAIIEATSVPPGTLRAECEVRDAAFIADDLGYAFARGASPARMSGRIDDLVGLVDRRRRWS